MVEQFLFIIVFSIFGNLLHGQSPEGIWITRDDKRHVDIAYVKIYKKDGMLFGKVIEFLPEALTRTCEGCTGNKKGQSLIDMDVIKNLEHDGRKYWTNGKLLDPKNGRQYDCSLWLDDPDTLKVRASLGISIIGRTQTWRRLN